jgi:hypothetical protein
VAVPAERRWRQPVDRNGFESLDQVRRCGLTMHWSEPRRHGGPCPRSIQSSACCPSFAAPFVHDQAIRRWFETCIP